MDVDGRVRFGGGLGERSSGAEDVIRIEVLVLADLFDGRLDATQGGRRHNRETVFTRLVELLEFLIAPFARPALFFQLGDDLIFLLLDVEFELLLGQLELVLGLQRDHHPAEVLADEILDQLLAGVAIAEAILFQDLVGKVSTGLEGQLFREDEGVVAVEEDVVDLCG